MLNFEFENWKFAKFAEFENHLILNLKFEKFLSFQKMLLLSWYYLSWKMQIGLIIEQLRICKFFVMGKIVFLHWVNTVNSQNRW
jgi:hypothetical protein